MTRVGSQRHSKKKISALNGIPGGAISSGTALQAGMSRVQFPVVLIKVFIDIFLRNSLWSTQPVTDISTRSIY